MLSCEEAELKERVWTHLNADYLERMAAKEAANTIAEEVRVLSTAVFVHTCLHTIRSRQRHTRR